LEQPDAVLEGQPFPGEDLVFDVVETCIIGSRFPAWACGWSQTLDDAVAARDSSITL